MQTAGDSQGDNLIYLTEPGRAITQISQESLRAYPVRNKDPIPLVNNFKR